MTIYVSDWYAIISCEILSNFLLSDSLYQAALSLLAAFSDTKWLFTIRANYD